MLLHIRYGLKKYLSLSINDVISTTIIIYFMECQNLR